MRVDGVFVAQQSHGSATPTPTTSSPTSTMSSVLLADGRTVAARKGVIVAVEGPEAARLLGAAMQVGGAVQVGAVMQVGGAGGRQTGPVPLLI